MTGRSGNTPVRILMSAINGYGYYYLKTLIEEIPDSKAVLVGVIDPEAKQSGYYPWIIEQRIPVFDKIDEFFHKGHSADLTVISSPPQYHVQQSIIALSNGSHVLADKPLGVDLESVRELIETSGRLKLWVELGYQWSFSKAIQGLKRDILDGKYGSPIRFKSICLWPREYNYYSRNNWAGRITDSTGRIVLDSPANNACAHFLHNLFYLLGDHMNSSAMPQHVIGERYRAYDIENYDTISLRAHTEGGAEVLFYASHATEKSRNPEFVLEFSGGIVSFGGNNPEIIGELNKGDLRNYGSPDDDHQFKKLFDAIRKVKQGGPDICPPEAAISQTICINQIQETGDAIIKFPDKILIETEKGRYVKGLYEMIGKAYEDCTQLEYKYH